jgi:3-hexulose-6-phosphate synthase
LAAASDATINGSIRAAKDFGKEIMVDLIRCAEIEKQLKRLDTLGADYVCVHTPIDDQNGENSPVAELKIAREVIQKSKLAIAGGLQIATLEEVLPYSPDIVIVGGGIVKSENMKEAAAQVKNILEKNGVQ